MLFYSRRKIRIIMWIIIIGALILSLWLMFLMIPQSGYYEQRANDLHERERTIAAPRGRILDRNGVVLVDNQSVCNITVIHNQITEPNKVADVLSKELDMDLEKVKKRVEKVSSIEKIKSNVPKEVGDAIRSYKLDGVNVDEDYVRYYPYSSLASKVLGFIGGDHQGIVGLEVVYDDVLSGKAGTLLTTTDVRGIEVDNSVEKRIEPIPGDDLYTSLDYAVQMYAAQVAEQVMEQKEAKAVSIILMNPQNGEIYAYVNTPEFDLNSPFQIDGEMTSNMELLNQMWRNGSLNDTYEPGSTFKIITATSALEAGVVSLSDTFHCPGYRVIDTWRIKCHKTVGHGSQTFLEGFMNSCNPVFMDVGARCGAGQLYETFNQLGLFEKTGIDLPGESSSIMHKETDVGVVELATISFGQSFQITPLQMLRAVSAVINGGTLVTPHLGVKTVSADGTNTKVISWESKEGAVSLQVSETMKMMLEKVVSEGTGNKAYIEGCLIGGKTATSQKLPRGSGKYIASFIGFAPADDPQILGIVLIDEPVGTYYGGTIAAPVMKTLFENVLPYMGLDGSLQ